MSWVVEGTTYIQVVILPGYSIFVVVGQLPQCEADDLLKIMPAVQMVKPQLLSDVADKGVVSSDDDVQRALDESQLLAAEEEELQAAIALSIQGQC